MIKKILVFVLVIFFIACIQKPITLDEVEIRNYEGQKLSSVEDFRENSIKGPQYIDKENYNLEVSGLVKNPTKYSYDDVINNHQHYQQVVTLDCVEGWSVTIFWEGVLVKDIIEQADPLPNATTVIFYAYDGYTTSFPLEYIMDNEIIMAYEMNNVTLPQERGFPFQLVAQSKWGYKWIKWIAKIELSDNPDYEGYWERRGYSNTGNLNESFLGR